MIGDALALAAWTQLFDEGLIVDPLPLLAACDHEMLRAMLHTYPAESGFSRMATAETCWRAELLREPYRWEVLGVGIARITMQLITRSAPTLFDIYSRNEAYVRSTEARR